MYDQFRLDMWSLKTGWILICNNGNSQTVGLEGRRLGCCVDDDVELQMSTGGGVYWIGYWWCVVWNMTVVLEIA